MATTKPEPKRSGSNGRSRGKETPGAGVDEETIQRLHTYDWAEFNRERRYLQRQVEWSPYVDMISAQDLELPVEDVESLMDSIEDMELLAYPLQGGQAHHPNRLFEDVRLQRV